MTATVSEGGVLVGVLAVVLGGGGLVLGLLRARRVALKKALPAPAIADEPAHR